MQLSWAAPSSASGAWRFGISSVGACPQKKEGMMVKLVPILHGSAVDLAVIRLA